MNNANIMMLHKQGKTVREIADLVNKSKTTVHRIILQEKRKAENSLDGSVPGGDVGQEGQSGQSYPLIFEPDHDDSFIFELDETYDAL